MIRGSGGFRAGEGAEAKRVKFMKFLFKYYKNIHGSRSFWRS
jgi:hypothetical protein